MRSVTLRFVAAALSLPLLAAGGAPAVDEPFEVDSRLDAVLRDWAKASDAVRESHFKIRSTTLDRTTDAASPSTDMEVFVRKPDLMRVDFKDRKGGLDTSVVYKEHTVHWFEAARKTHSFYTLPDGYGFPEHPDRYPDNFFASFRGGFLEYCSWPTFGPPINDLKTRFEIRLTKEDDNWIFLEIKPRRRRDRNLLTQMQVVLSSHSFRLRRLWLEQSGSTETTFNFEEPIEDAAEIIAPESILKDLPEDYKVIDIDHLNDGSHQPLKADDSKP